MQMAQLEEMTEILFSYYKGEISARQCSEQVCGMTTFEQQKVQIAAQARLRLWEQAQWEAGVATANSEEG